MIHVLIFSFICTVRESLRVSRIAIEIVCLRRLQVNMEKPSTDQPRETKPEASSGIECLIRIPEIKRQDLGLKVLYENQDVDEIEVE